MKRLMTLFTAALLLLGVAVAQDAPAAGGQAQSANTAQGRVRRGGGLDRLDLTGAQKSQLKSLREQQHQQLQALRQNQSLTQDQRREQAQKIHQQFRSQMQGILTPEQQAQLKQMRGRRGGPMARLNLTDEQRAKLQPIMQQQREQVRAIRNDSSLSQQQKQDKIRELRQSTMSQMQGILTPEQQQQMQQWQQNRRGRHGRAPGAVPQGL